MQTCEIDGFLAVFLIWKNHETTGFDPTQQDKIFDAILLDSDHSPSEFLNESNTSFYCHKNLTLKAKQLCPDGVFSIWSQN